MPTLPDSPSPSPQPDGISLQELREAFAQAMGRPGRLEPAGKGSTPGGEEPPPGDQSKAGGADPAGDADQAPAETGPEPADDDPCEVSPLSILEAMLFVGNRMSEPLTAAEAAGLMRGVEPGEIPGLIEQLNRRYAASGCPYHVVSEGPGYRMALRGEFSDVRHKFYGRVREARLSQAAVDVLAIVAYRQPITGEEVSKLRGTPSSHLLNQLVRRRLLSLERSAEKPRTVHYRTTERFLGLFGLGSLGDLPQSDDPELK
jgi:segregation and condensation protein B